jgi:hypothetical protein
MTESQRKTSNPMTESQLQHAIVMYFNAAHRHEAMLVHVPNARKQSAAQGAVWRGLGVVAGFPDLMVIKANQCLLVELKTPDGTVSKVQKDLHKVLADQGTKVHVARSLEEFIFLVTTWLSAIK